MTNKTFKNAMSRLKRMYADMGEIDMKKAEYIKSEFIKEFSKRSDPLSQISDFQKIQPKTSDDIIDNRNFIAIFQLLQAEGLLRKLQVNSFDIGIFNLYCNVGHIGNSCNSKKHKSLK